MQTSLADMNKSYNVKFFSQHDSDMTHLVLCMDGTPQLTKKKQ